MEQINQRISVYCDLYLDLVRTQFQRQEEQNVIMRSEYEEANCDSVRRNDWAASLRTSMLEMFLTNNKEIKRMTSFPTPVFVGILQHMSVGGSVCELLEYLLLDKGIVDYQGAYALMETMHYLVAGSTYKQAANMFLTGQFELAKVIRISMRALANSLNPPRVGCINIVCYK